ncbi:hypothetical protein PCH_Pc20g07420 [Penicillium rubens Wisconsin 54-1255]|uniref:Uncharacterized protein n=1 Tax=Penicillium rubens (strain ATCC 28089 / DSM 1075 / NRRL 1951 / Wisconsin 54-1255) TaxID=500485 RepID=B6HDE8_PENRW|nr:hypothetical protein PCH_Pc20g07420 [Penicillium rubens Wisconsin 54-1255]
MADDILILSSISYTLPGRHLNRYDAYFLVGGDIQTSWPTLSEKSWVICASPGKLDSESTSLRASPVEDRTPRKYTVVGFIPTCPCWETQPWKADISKFIPIWRWRWYS